MSTCDVVVAIDHGCFVTSGTPEEVRHHPKVIESYLGEVVTEDSPDDGHGHGTRDSADADLPRLEVAAPLEGGPA
jgi:hypothetical protein